jgi:hypothetical protein
MTIYLGASHLPVKNIPGKRVRLLQTHFPQQVGIAMVLVQILHQGIDLHARPRGITLLEGSVQPFEGLVLLKSPRFTPIVIRADSDMARCRKTQL